MPITRIEVKKHWPAKKQKFFIQTARVAALPIPQHHRLIRFIEHRAELFSAPQGKIYENRNQ